MVSFMGNSIAVGDKFVFKLFVQIRIPYFGLEPAITHCSLYLLQHVTASGLYSLGIRFFCRHQSVSATALAETVFASWSSVFWKLARSAVNSRSLYTASFWIVGSNSIGMYSHLSICVRSS